MGVNLKYIYIILGSKSQSRPNDPPIMKEQKIAQPASRRVRDAAEGLLSSLMEQVDFYTVYCGAESLSSTIGKKHALKKYDQFAQNTSCFCESCAISRNFWYKNNELMNLLLLLKQKFLEISQF